MQGYIKYRRVEDLCAFFSLKIFVSGEHIGLFECLLPELFGLLVCRWFPL